MGNRDERDLREDALGLLLRAEIKHHPDLVAPISTPSAVLRTARGQVGAETLRSTIEKVSLHLPRELKVGEAVEKDGTVIAPITREDPSAPQPPMFIAAGSGLDQHGKRWIVVAGMHATPVVTTSEDEMRRIANVLNDRCPVGAWGASGDIVLLNGTCCPEGSQDGETWQRIAAMAVTDTLAYGNAGILSLNGDEATHEPLIVMRAEEESFIRSAGEGYDLGQVHEALRDLIGTFPPALGRSIDIDTHGDIVDVRIPSPGPTDSISIRIGVNHQRQGDLIPGGIVVHATVGTPQEEDVASRWCERLNGFSMGEDDPSALTTPWQLGNWYHIPSSITREEALQEVCYYGVVPHRARNLVNLVDVLSGVLREIYMSGERMEQARKLSFSYREEEEGEGYAEDTRIMSFGDPVAEALDTLARRDSRRSSHELARLIIAMVTEEDLDEEDLEELGIDSNSMRRMREIAEEDISEDNLVQRLMHEYEEKLKDLTHAGSDEAAARLAILVEARTSGTFDLEEAARRAGEKA